MEKCKEENDCHILKAKIKCIIIIVHFLVKKSNLIGLQKVLALSKVVKLIKIIQHELSEKHIIPSIKISYKEAAFLLIPSLIENDNSRVAHKKEIIRHLIDITLLLGRHCQPFFGHNEDKQENTRGNFKDLAVLLLTKYSPVLSSHITEVEIKGRKTNNFSSWQRQNQLIQAISMNIIKFSFSRNY